MKGKVAHILCNICYNGPTSYWPYVYNNFCASRKVHIGALKNFMASKFFPECLIHFKFGQQILNDDQIEDFLSVYCLYLLKKKTFEQNLKSLGKSKKFKFFVIQMVHPSDVLFSHILSKTWKLCLVIQSSVDPKLNILSRTHLGNKFYYHR